MTDVRYHACPECCQRDMNNCTDLCRGDAISMHEESVSLHARIYALEAVMRGYVTYCERCEGTGEIAGRCLVSCALFNSAACPSETPTDDKLRCPSVPCPVCAPARTVLEVKP